MWGLGGPPLDYYPEVGPDERSEAGGKTPDEGHQHREPHRGADAKELGYSPG